MAKILVADDNSNIQKMVGLALKDQGIDVVAVGNGEAAVRKISDLHPDLVLADVFMPVRNGYEVCEFVKNDHRLAHIPVILLVGAFDPLDEHEAQRVGADGVLKKPFVPPDPLISMVKSTLARVAAEAEALVSASAVLAGQAASANPSGPVTPPRASVPPAGPSSSESTEAVAEEMPVPALPVSIDAAHQPLAFGSLLETPAAAVDEKEDDLSFMPASQPELTDQHSWRSHGVQEEEEEPEHPWRRDVPDEIFQALPTEEPARTEIEPFAEVTPVLEEAKPEDAGAVEPSLVGLPEVEGSAPIVESAPALEPLALATAPLDEFPPENYPGLYVEEKIVPLENASEPTQEPLVEQEIVPPASVVSMWEEEVRKASQLSNTWNQEESQAPSEPAGAEFPPPSADPDIPATEPEPYEPLPAAPIEEPPPVPEESDLSRGGAQVNPVPAWHEQLQSAAAEVKAEQPAPLEHLEAATAPVQPASPDVDAIVAKVLAKMNPEVLQQVSRDILKPLIEALLRDEIEKKN
ncbi:MAG: response regulator [Candidatus Acidiferrales bacterium]